MQVRNIPVADIIPSDLNPRKTFDQNELQELADSIKENGLVQPITIRKTDREDGKYEVVCGERRLRAFQLLGEKTIPAVVKKLEDRKAFAIMIIENLQRKDIDPMEEATALKRLWDEKTMTIAEMAKLLGKSSSFVVSRIQLTNIIPEFVKLMKDGTLFLVHLQGICKLPQDAQKVLYENCFTQECITRWDFKVLKLDLMQEWIDTYCMNYLDNANFNLADESFDFAPSCATCPLNTKNNAETFKDCKQPRCMKRECFLAKQRETVFRDAQTSGLPLVYTGTAAENKEVITTAEGKGLALTPVGKRSYVVEPIAPREEDFNDEETYMKRKANYDKVREAFDSNLADGTVEKVYEVAFSGRVSGEVKYLYTAPDIDSNDEKAVKEEEFKKERITEFKKRLAASKRERELEIVEMQRRYMESSDFSDDHSDLFEEEEAVFYAILLKRLGYAFKESIGFGMEQNADYRKAIDIIQKNKTQIMRAVIKETLSEKSVCFSQDLANMLAFVMSNTYEDKAKEIKDVVDVKYDAIEKGLQEKIDEIRKPTEETE